MMNCPLLGHPLVDGVLVENQALVRFMQKVFVDFRPHELICRRCYREALATYTDKYNRAKELKLSRLEASSVSTIKSSTTSSSSGLLNVSQNSNDSYDQLITKTPYHEKAKKSSILSKSSRSALNNSSLALTTPRVQKSGVRLSQEPTTSAQAITEFGALPIRTTSVASTSSTSTAATVRKSTINDFFAPKVRVVQNLTNGIAVQNVSQTNQRRDSQLPTTSAAAAAVYANGNESSSDDDGSPRRSLNYYNGTRLPNVQPFPPRPKPRLNHSPSVMDEYIRDITGG